MFDDGVGAAASGPISNRASRNSTRRLRRAPSNVGRRFTGPRALANVFRLVVAAFVAIATFTAPAAALPGSFTLSNDPPVWDTVSPAGPAVQLRWTASSNATSYEVYRNGTKIYPSSGTFTGTAFYNSLGLTSGQTYSYFIIARNATGATQSNTINVGPMPSAPTPLPGSFSLSNDPPVWDTVSPAGPAVQLRWTASSNATSYEVYRNGTKIFPSSGTFTGTSFYNNAGLTSGQTYSYFVIARNATGTTQSNTINVGPMPSAPTLAPVINSVGPNPVTGSANLQTITINGANFVNKPTVILTWTVAPLPPAGGYTVPTAHATFINSTQLQISIITSISADTWTVKVVNPDGRESNVVNLQVVAPVGGHQLVVNGHVLTGNEATWITYVGTQILPQLLGTLSDRVTVASRVSWWSLKEGIFSLNNPHVFSNCNTVSGDIRHDVDTDAGALFTCEPGMAWQVGLSGVQVGSYSHQKVLDAINALWPGRATTDVLAEAARLVGYDPSTGIGASIVASTGYLRRSWLLRHPVVGMYLEEQAVTAECINDSKSWCYGTGWAATQLYAPTRQAAFQSISDIAAIFTTGVGSSAPTCGLSANPSTINLGQSTTLAWTSQNATSGTLDNGIGPVSPVASGSLNVTPAQTTTYTGTFAGPGGSASCSPITVAVTSSGGVVDYPGAVWHGPVANTNFAPGRSGNSVGYIIVHTIDGPSMQSAVDRFQTVGQEASAHYIIGTNGDVWQVVREADTAFHSGNLSYNQQSIGIELEGRSDGNLVNGSEDFSWQSVAQRAALKNVVNWLLSRYPAILTDRAHILGHNQVPSPGSPYPPATEWGGANNHHDPGAWYNWRQLMTDLGRPPSFTPIKVQSATSILTMPTAGAPIIAPAAPGQKFVAYDTTNGYYLVFVSGNELPQTNLGSGEYHWDGWIPANSVVTDNTAIQLEVVNAFPSRWLIHSSASLSGAVVGKTIDGKRYVSTGNTASADGHTWREFYIATTDNAIATGWAVSEAFTVIGGSQTGYALSVSVSGSGTVTSSPAGINCPGSCVNQYSSGTSVTLGAAAASGWSFTGWSGACTGSGSCTVGMTQAQNVTATFTQTSTTFALSVSLSGSGTVTSSPAGINCPGTCINQFAGGTNVDLTATSASGWNFSGWTGACGGTGACSVGMSQAQNVTATFTQMVAAPPIRTFVSIIGSDSNPCTFALPCKSAQHAHDVVAAGGEIRMLDPAAYGLLTITKAISILGGGHGGIAASGGATAITINAGANDKVNIRGVLLEGFGSGNYGVIFNAGASLSIQDCVIRNFVFDGIRFQPNAASKLSVSSTVISDLSNGNGITVLPSGSRIVTGSLNEVEINNTGSDGLLVVGSGSSGIVDFTVSNSAIANNTFYGIVSASFGGAQTAVTVQNSMIVNHGVQGLLANGGSAVLHVTQSTISGNGTGLGTANGARLVSYGDNNLDGNTSNGTASGMIGPD